MSKPLLSICIPTFNRCEYLKNTIRSIVIQPEFLDGKVELIICDNASEDDTTSVVEEFLKNFPKIRYYRNDYNLGASENFLLALSRAKGILRRLNNDTFVLKKDALSKMCEIVEKYILTRPLIVFTDGNRPSIKNETTLSFNNFVVQASFMVTWSGAFSIWEEECEGIEKDTRDCETLLWQVRKVYEMGYKKQICVINNDSMGETQKVKSRDMSYGLHKVFYNNFLGLLKPYVDNKAISLKEYEQIRKDLLYNFFTTRIIDWELQRDEINYSKEEDFKKLIFEEYKDAPYWNSYKRFYYKKVLKRKYKNFLKKLLGKK